MSNSQSAKCYKQTEVGVIPTAWDVPQLGDISREDSPICYGIVQVGTHDRKGVPVLAIKNLNSDYKTNIHRASKETEKPYSRSRIHPNDVLISVKGTTGRVGITPDDFYGNISRDIARLRLNEMIVPRFCFQMLQSEMMQRRIASAVVGTTRMELSIATLKQLRIPIPPTKAEQEAIAEALSDADALIESLEQLIAKKRQIKQGAMQELLTGKRRLPGFSGEWEVKKLGKICEIAIGRTPSRLNQAFWGQGYKWLSIADLQSKIVSIRPFKFEVQQGLTNPRVSLAVFDSQALFGVGRLTVLGPSVPARL